MLKKTDNNCKKQNLDDKKEKKITVKRNSTLFGQKLYGNFEPNTTETRKVQPLLGGS